ncbi:hypothetical protein D3C76_1605130 [compost metagenome]
MHGAGRIHPGVLHHLGHGLVPHRLARPLHPGEDHGFVLLGRHRAVEVGLLAVGHVIPPALQHPGGAIFEKDGVKQPRMIDQGLLVDRGHGDHESVYI